jgi:hypothetical protein
MTYDNVEKRNTCTIRCFRRCTKYEFGNFYIALVDEFVTFVRQKCFMYVHNNRIDERMPNYSLFCRKNYRYNQYL